MQKKRVCTSKPIVGIRPTIDGRQGVIDVRGSLEEQTMEMAKSVSKLLSENIKYTDGSPLEVVISNSTIGRVAEAADCEDQFRKAGVDITITVTPCWCYGAETMDMNPHTIKAVWGFNGTERPGAVYLASVLATHTQKGLPAFGIYGHDVQEADDRLIPKDVAEKLLRFTRASLAAASLRGNSYLQIGSICMGIGGSIIDHDLIEDYLGMRVESVDQTEVVRRISEGIYDEEEYDLAWNWINQYCKEGFDKNPIDLQRTDQMKEEEWQFVTKMALVIKDLMSGNEKLKDKFPEESLGHNAIVAGFQGQRQWTDFYPNCDFPEAILNTSFDWSGAREPYVLATENDVLNGISMLFMKLLTNKAQLFSDVRTFWSEESVEKATNYKLEGKAKDSKGILHLINSGASSLDFNAQASENGQGTIKAWYDLSQEDQENIMDNVTWNAADLGYFRGGGYSSRFETKVELPVTMIRLNLVKGLGPTMQIAEGWTVELPDEVSDELWKRTDYTWPSTWFAPRCTDDEVFKNAYNVMNAWGANHGAISHGHIGADIITLCSILRIPVSMHNIAEEDIFRPSAWDAFGMDKEGQDYRACSVYGALFKK